MTSVSFPRQLRPSGAEAIQAQELENLGVLHTGPEERFDRLALLTRQVFDAAGAGIAMQDAGHPFLKSAIGLPSTDSTEARELARTAMAHSGTHVVEAVPPSAGYGVLARQRAIRFYAGQPVISPGGTHVGTLFVVDHRSRTFSERDEKLLAELKWWVERELRHSAELDQAAEVQRKLMPENPPHVPGYEIAATCVPCRGVGGDFFDWYHTDRGLAMTLGDVMGKGIGAAMVMSVACNILRAAGRQYPPAQAVEFADLALREELESTATMITVCHGELDPETHRVRYVDAGHGLMMSMYPDGTVRERPTGMGSLPLGVLPGETRPEVAVQIGPGEIALMFSDGLLDLYDGTVASLEVIAREAYACADRGAQAIVDHFAERARDTVLADDVTVYVIRRVPS
ncbi:MAG TPA: GAF domain-containing SpoIIE family protein phosphatase [Actinophytocola sp.]|uniref:PP2C family protein-serine/threonine phosphatase n=1 Tax=Actinophytocola sp. TaxID=1872138 RepID=UPI002DC02F6A|nr:GAF domain-containing SpoIIE family protein phosphatase [Actinophytocola sp.]HEU5472444.1 GAF domain-containing SpoIIE family protein phosphatase [Actinophytocola sp.]